MAAAEYGPSPNWQLDDGQVRSKVIVASKVVAITCEFGYKLANSKLPPVAVTGMAVPAVGANLPRSP